MPFPKFHRLAEDPGFDVLGAKMRGRGQSVRPRSDDRDVTRSCVLPQHASESPVVAAGKASRMPCGRKRAAVQFVGGKRVRLVTEVWLEGTVGLYKGRRALQCHACLVDERR